MKYSLTANWTLSPGYFFIFILKQINSLEVILEVHLNLLDRSKPHITAAERVV